MNLSSLFNLDAWWWKFSPACYPTLASSNIWEENIFHHTELNPIFQSHWPPLYYLSPYLFKPNIEGYLTENLYKNYSHSYLLWRNTTGRKPYGLGWAELGIEPRTLVKTCQTSKGFIYFCFLAEYFLFMILFPLPRGTFTRIFKIDTSPHNLPLLPTPSHHCWSSKIKVKKTAD